ncbi:hypothetical protein ZHAS_00013686 [Anopheles sinensis]|uniref:Uncharacterized protein n=1 Tax=Anopheles sinensis TaxID=74873 RepID=A0A084W6I0_ANOSI|nr:hypothetical protein ZHAS_00013686 [Anopheles sinensis]
MARSTLFIFAALVLASVTFAQDPTPLSLEDIRQEALARIQAANVTLPAGGTGAKSLQSYRIIDPYIIADLLNAIAYIYSYIIYNYPEYVLYDSLDLKLLSARYIPQRLEFNYVNRV